MNPIDTISARSATEVASSAAESAKKSPPVNAVKAVKPAVQDAQSDAEATQKKPGPAAISSAVEKLNSLGNAASPALQFEIDSDREVVVIKVINRSTGEIIRELPPEAAVDAATRGDGALPSLVKENA